MSDASDVEAKARFSLPKTGLRVYSDRIVRTNTEGETLLDLPLTSITTVEYRRVFEHFSFAFFFLAIALFIIAVAVVSADWLRILLCIAGAISGFIAIAGMFSHHLFVHTSSGEMEINGDESAEELQAFAVGVNEFLKTRQR
ncbi:MAG: hypothetical protein ACRC8S_03780 [Fimbriiglobus sp.]